MSRDRRTRSREASRPRRRRDPIGSYQDRPTSVIYGSLLVGGGFFLGLLLVRVMPFQLGPSDVDPTNIVFDAELLNAFVINLALVEVGFPVAALGFLYYRGNSIRDLGLGTPTARDAVRIVAGTAGLLTVNLGFLAATGALDGAGLPLADTLDRTTVILTIGAVMFLVVAPGEELLFRGVIQRYLVGPFSRRGAVVAAAVMFAVAHVLNASLSPNPRVILVADLFGGLVLGAVYEYTDNLLSPTIVHGTYNTVLFSLVMT